MSNIVEPNWLTVTGLVFLFSGLVVLCTAVQSGSWGGQRVARGSTLGSYQRAASAMSAVFIAVGLGAQLLGQFFIAPLATSIVVVLLALALFLLFFALTADMLFEAPEARSETSARGGISSDAADALVVEGGQGTAGRLRIAS